MSNVTVMFSKTQLLVSSWHVEPNLIACDLERIVTLRTSRSRSGPSNELIGEMPSSATSMSELVMRTRVDESGSTASEGRTVNLPIQACCRGIGRLRVRLSQGAVGLVDARLVEKTRGMSPRERRRGWGSNRRRTPSWPPSR